MCLFFPNRRTLSSDPRRRLVAPPTKSCKAFASRLECRVVLVVAIEPNISSLRNFSLWEQNSPRAAYCFPHSSLLPRYILRGGGTGKGGGPSGKNGGGCSGGHDP